MTERDPIDVERVERLEDALTRIRQWAEAYPVKFFTTVPDDEVRRAGQLLKAEGISMDALHAGWARYLLDGVREVAAAALEGRKER
jgi:hypothetical protein